VIVASAPGRVNLIGDHTDYTGGLVLPMAIDRRTTIRGKRGGAEVVLRSAHEPEVARVPLDVADPHTVTPTWARYVAGVIAELRPSIGFEGEVTTTIPIGAGLSSSAALEVAAAIALGWSGDSLGLALMCQRAEQRASGVPCGIMDQLISAEGSEAGALLIDCGDLATPRVIVPLPAGAEVVVVHSGEARSLAGSAYADRVRECAAAEREIGPLRVATLDDVERIEDVVVRARARHVVSENRRVRELAGALTASDLHAAGQIMDASHASLRDDYEVSTPALDGLVEALRTRPGVYGARLTGAGFGGCVVALCRTGAVRDNGWVVKPARGAVSRAEPPAARGRAAF
jgi:galactokinase